MRPISKSISIQADAPSVWNLLVEPASIKVWFSDCDLEVSVDLVMGGGIMSRGDWHGIALENKGKIVALEDGKRLAYKHWSSLSQLPDSEENYTLIRYDLTAAAEGTTLALRQENLLTPEIHGHWNFYWNMALDRIKRLAETGHL